jgi:ParB-like chromosome segregation protein Spo0J|tara:strand:- start:1219 stop:1812 length:594 start_codon:yes stop_codon:yes gene_type:complete
MKIQNHTNEKLTDISKVIANPRNPNKHSDKQINMLSKIIEFQGWRLPIVVSNRSGFIVRGHGRLMSARKLELDQVPVSFQDYESEAQEHADLIADNRIAELAELDRTELKDIIEQLDTGEMDLDFTGFDLESLNDLMSEFYVDDFSEKNQEIDANELDEEMKLELLFSFEDYQRVIEKLNELNSDKAQALLQILFDE